jgi:hypothetical protein
MAGCYARSVSATRAAAGAKTCQSRWRLASVGYVVGFGSALGCTVEPEQHAPQQFPHVHAITTTSQLI